MNFEFQKTKTIISILIAVIITPFLLFIGRCIDSPCGDINLFGGYVLTFTNPIPYLGDLIIPFIIVIVVIYLVWSFFQKKVL